MVGSVGVVPMERLWAKVQMGGPDECWPWLSPSTTPGGYPLLSVGGRTRLAHRWLWEQNHGPLPAGWEVDHTCENILCMNQVHHEAVTKAENRRRQAAAARRRVCDVADCGRPHRALGLCASHWWKQYRETHPRKS